MNLIQNIALDCQMTMVGMKGKQRDIGACAFWRGAGSALTHAGDEANAAWVYRVAYLLIGTRGYSEVERIVGEAETEEEV